MTTSKFGSELSRRESEVLRAIADGHTVPWIAAKSTKDTELSIRYVLACVREKLGASSTTHAVHLAHQKGILS